MRFESPSVQKIGTWILLVGFVLVTIALPAAGPPAIFAEIIVLIFILEIVSPVELPAPQPVCSGYRFGIPPRSPPSC
jgi:hypothetical protein